MRLPPDFVIDHLACACLTTSRDRRILFANQYLADALALSRESLVGEMLETLFSKSSRLFCESYVLPTVLKEATCREVQLYLMTSSGQKVPVVANAKLMPNGDICWIFVEAENRNKLFHELEEARAALQSQKEQLAILSRTDALTGTDNRRSLDESTQTMFANADQTGEPVAVIVIDIDHFKRINDTHGHHTGDRALKALGTTLKAICRGSDFVSRHGGAEFTILMNDTKVEQAAVVCKRIHVAVAGLMLGICPFTVSIGVSGRTGEKGENSKEVFDQADRALYDAKHAGRNTTVIHAALNPAPTTPIFSSVPPSRSQFAR